MRYRCIEEPRSMEMLKEAKSLKSILKTLAGPIRKTRLGRLRAAGHTAGLGLGNTPVIRLRRELAKTTQHAADLEQQLKQLKISAKDKAWANLPGYGKAAVIGGGGLAGGTALGMLLTGGMKKRRAKKKAAEDAARKADMIKELAPSE